MLEYVQGDVTKPMGSGNKIIAHVVNNKKRWGKGVVLAISARWQLPEKGYRGWDTLSFVLGNIQLHQVEENLYVCNMLAQNGLRSKTNPQPADLVALTICLGKLASYAKNLKASVHMPRICSGLGGAPWEKVLYLIEENLKDLPVFIYDLVK